MAQTDRSLSRATDQPFFAQGNSGHAQPGSPAGVTSRLQVNELPDVVQRFYALADSNVEFHLHRRYTILSLDEVAERRFAMVAAGCSHDFVDFIVEYIGMGHVHVWSVNADGEVHQRVDGGANGLDRADNAISALGPRQANQPPIGAFCLEA